MSLPETSPYFNAVDIFPDAPLPLSQRYQLGANLPDAGENRQTIRNFPPSGVLLFLNPHDYDLPASVVLMAENFPHIFLRGGELVEINGEFQLALQTNIGKKVSLNMIQAVQFFDQSRIRDLKELLPSCQISGDEITLLLGERKAMIKTSGHLEVPWEFLGISGLVETGGRWFGVKKSLRIYQDDDYWYFEAMLTDTPWYKYKELNYSLIAGGIRIRKPGTGCHTIATGNIEKTLNEIQAIARTCNGANMVLSGSDKGLTDITLLEQRFRSLVNPYLTCY